MIQIEDILKSGNVPKEARKAIKQEIAAAKLNPKKRELLRNEWFDISKTLLSSGADASLVLDGLEDLMRMMDGNDASDEKNEIVRIGFSPGKDCKNLIINHLTGAQKSLDICVFTISDNDIADCIIRRHKAGIRIRLIGDNEKAEDEGSDMRRMAEAGIPVKIDYSPNHMHHKFSLGDGEELLTGSYNWTRSAEQYNQENLVVWRNSGAALPFQKEFDRLWNSLVDY